LLRILGRRAPARGSYPAPPPGPSGSHQYLRARRTGWMSASATPAVFGSAPASRCRPMRDPPRRGG